MSVLVALLLSGCSLLKSKDEVKETPQTPTELIRLLEGHCQFAVIRWDKVREDFYVACYQAGAKNSRMGF